jgi:hypothetical protein
MTSIYAGNHPIVIYPRASSRVMWRINQSMNSQSGTDLVLDDVHSFVLRISLNRGHGGRGTPRPQFHLEHVNTRTASRTNKLEEVLDLLRTEINIVFEALDFHESS